MCKDTVRTTKPLAPPSGTGKAAANPLKTPTMLERYGCASVLTALMAVWAKFTFVPESELPGLPDHPVHSWKITLALSTGYLISLPLLRAFADRYLTTKYDVKVLLTESMVLYNVVQVALNGWMVYRMIKALMFEGLPFIGDLVTVTGAQYAVWVHYCDKYLEFFDTYFMVLRGKMDQVSFLHVYHHFSISWGWWIAMRYTRGGDIYFGALLNSFIHVMMYSYYALALLKISCPWKRYLTQAQLLQFATVMAYTAVCVNLWPKDQVNRGHYLCAVVQVWEMASLFLLFALFYRKSYGGKKKGGGAGAKQSEDDQCHKAVLKGTETALEVSGKATDCAKKMAERAAKDAGRVVGGAAKAVREGSEPARRVAEGGMSQPSWSIVS